MTLSPRLPLAAPRAVVAVARETMGGIDLDGNGDATLSPMLGAREFRLPSDPLRWRPPGRGRVFASITDGGLRRCRLLLSTLQEAWRLGAADGDVKEAVAWTTYGEIQRHCPWIWDAPLMTCVPYRRLPPRFYDDELEMLAPADPGRWGFLLYFPRMDSLASSRARFYGAAGRIGRVIEVGAQPADWREGYLACTGKPYDEAPQ